MGCFRTLLWLASLPVVDLSPIQHQIPEHSGESYCDSNKTCYPLIFEPSNQWQTIREGQQIPAGLHVRINMNTGFREAKLLDESAVATDAHERDKAVDVVLQVSGEEGDVEIQDKQGFDLLNEQGQVRSALQMIGLNISQDLMDHALDSLVDLTHEREYGVMVVKLNLNGVLGLLSSDRPTVREKISRVIGASFRNNEDAFHEAKLEGAVLVLHRLIGALDKETDDSVTPRLIYAIHAIASCPENIAAGPALRQILLSRDQADILRRVFRQGSPVAQVKCARLTREVWDSSARSSDESQQVRGDTAMGRTEAESARLQKEAELWTQTLQEELVKRQEPPVYRRELEYETLKALVHFKRTYPSLSMSSAFTAWLAREYDHATGQAGTHKQDASDTTHDSLKEDYLSLVKEVRHSVFGNAKARKHFGDEL